MTLEKIFSPGNMGRSIIQHDPRSRRYPARALVDTNKPRDRGWRRGEAYDQGWTSTCVAQTGKGLLNSAPMSAKVDYDLRSKYSIDQIYRGAQARDEWEGENYDGTSGLGLCKYFLDLGLINEYRWCFGLQDVLLALSYIGPVGLGVWWYTGMFDPDISGFIWPTGDQEGGHEVELIGVDVSEKCVIGMNSWGKDWGNRGRFKLSWSSLETLLEQQGDAFVILR